MEGDHIREVIVYGVECDAPGGAPGHGLLQALADPARPEDETIPGPLGVQDGADHVLPRLPDLRVAVDAQGPVEINSVNQEYPPQI